MIQRLQKVTLEEFGNRLKTSRKSKGIPQTKIADKIGITRQSMGNYETGRQYPTVEILIKIADYLGCSIDYLLGRVDTLTGMSKDDEEIIRNAERYRCNERTRALLTPCIKDIIKICESQLKFMDNDSLPEEEETL